MMVCYCGKCALSFVIVVKAPQEKPLRSDQQIPAKTQREEMEEGKKNVSLTDMIEKQKKEVNLKAAKGLWLTP